MAPLVTDKIAPELLVDTGHKSAAATRSMSIYQCLRPNEIRIAKIDPVSAVNKELSCTLLPASVDNVASYKALSYCWGTSIDTRSIYINGEAVLVTSTLADALQVLRPKQGDEALLIWIDVLCIDQNNLEERGEQVEKMQLIYERASEVIVWLGSAGNGSNLAWQLVNDLHGCHGDRSRIAQLFNASRIPQFDALRMLFRREYWFRIWVVQEVTCAKQVTVYCGTQCMSWPLLEDACALMIEFSRLLKDNIYYDQPSHVFSLMRGGPRSLQVKSTSSTGIWSQSLPTLLELLYLHGSKLSTDPSDKVNAVVGISSARNSFGHVDYTRSVAETFVHTARYLITSTKKLDIICYSQNDENVFDLPTWVPDWQRRNLHPKHRPVGLHIRRPAFKAAGDSSGQFSFLGDKDNVLGAEGFVFDVITSAGDKFYLDGPESDVLPTLKTLTSWWRTVASTQGSDHHVQAVFQRSFCGGAWMPDYEEEADHRLPLFFGLAERLLPGSLDWCPAVQNLHQTAVRHGQSDEMLEKRQRAMAASAALRMHSKRIVVTRRGSVGLAPMAAEVGDCFVLLFGCTFPIVLRKSGSDGWVLIGGVYVDGIMYGEAMEPFRLGHFEQARFQIH